MLGFFKLVILSKPLCIRQIDIILELRVHVGQLKCLSQSHHTE